MMDVLKIGAAFGLIVLLLRLRWNLGLVMLLGAVLLGSVYLIGPVEQAKVILASSIDIVTIDVVAALALIMVLENILRKKGVLKRMMDSLVNVARDRRIAMAALPGVIGLLPSAGGAAFSAPMVQEAAADADITPERKAFVNYWFRHIWEYISPLYPGFLLATAVTGTPINTFLLSQLPLPLAVVGVGGFLGFRGMPMQRERTKGDLKDVKTLFITLLPITVSIILVIFFKMRLAIAMAAIVAAMLLLYRYSPQEILTTLRESLSLNALFMVVGIMVFKGMLEASGAIEALPLFFQRSGLPVGAVVFALPFLVGLLTGLTVGFVGATFPLIMVMMGGHPAPAVVTFAFASGFAGIMLSPTHLCLLLTVRYFNADMAGVYRLMYLPVFLVFAVGLIQYWVLS
jgi:integral membrane protein (TIGR00529 family)